LYRMVEPGQSIPFELYAAVAGILAFLYRQKVEERMRRERQAHVAQKNVGHRGAAAISMYGFGGGI
jgi:flagellar biosynthetic protein FlhB